MLPQARSVILRHYVSPPTITSSASPSVAENATLSHSLTANQAVAWSLVGGADLAKFELSGLSTLRFASNATKDFEAPDDADTNNTYVVTVRAINVQGRATNQTITVTVTDVSEIPTDPNYSNVVFLWEMEGTNGQNSGLAELKNGRTVTIGGNGQLSSAQARLGSTSFLTGTGGWNSAANTDYRLGNSSNASQFTIEFSYYSVTSLNQHELLRVWQGSEKSWWLRHQGDGQLRFLASSDGTSSFSMDVTTTGLGIVANAWNDIRIDKDATGKLRFFRNGVMKYSTTPADSAFFNSTNSPLTHEPGASTTYLDHLRLTASVARSGTDSSYTVEESAFPTS